jgi:hypothetical protein
MSIVEKATVGTGGKVVVKSCDYWEAVIQGATDGTCAQRLREAMDVDDGRLPVSAIQKGSH